ncbi:right-handed parallel beta-helix repeat-containing protein [Natrinema salsiterrestre]|uniref:Right-handed parallel beta-helix repeat-containing protein n=1 Tax=Natrinema salsiterrestre TaxID=2950540 RepID=A0A9Q4KXI9_9EURY|nr:right-handed parallel beta-helix repeat-containing protein [Natrinema salsiterrestre]MDF9745208.1 right-handed parallel beta-helix repeat-containing protein [Natrinema salsiterrestre]
MGERTPRLDLGTFEEGEEWDHTDTVEAVDEHAIVRGPISDRPAEGEYDDELYHATDQGITWRWDAADEDWVYFGGRGSSEQPVPGTSHFEAAEFVDARTAETPVWNVEAHGIEGDGETEVGRDVHDLLAEVESAGGGIVYFPPGRYVLERTPLIGDDTILLGAGRATVFEGSRPDGEEGRALVSNRGYDGVEYGGASNWGIRNVRIDSPETNGIMLAHAENVRLENVYGDRIYYHHIDVVSSTNVTIDGYWATRGGDAGSNAPIQFDNQTSEIASNSIWDGTDESLTGSDGTRTQNCTLENFEIDPENGPEYGVHMHRNGNESITIRDGYITGCLYAAIRGDTGDEIADLTIDRVSCIENARGISLGQLESGRRELTITNVTIRTDNRGLAAGSGIYAAGFDGAEISNTIVDGAFTNSILFDDMDDLKLSTVTAKGASDQAFRFRENVDATLTTARAADCGDAGVYAGPGSSVAYGGVTFEAVGSEVVVDGELREWNASS